VDDFLKNENFIPKMRKVGIWHKSGKKSRFGLKKGYSPETIMCQIFIEIEMKIKLQPV